MKTADRWLRDIPQQFQGKPKIEVLIKAFARQLQELSDVFSCLNDNTDLDTATGQNLDYVGTIIPLTRKQAGELTRIGDTDPVMSDERYRQYLRYQMLKNTNECTYYDLMKGIELLWDIKPVYYEEDPALPATIILTMPFLKPGGETAAVLGEVPMIKPAGVGLTFLYYIRILVEAAYSLLLCVYDIPRCNTIVCGTYPHTATLGTIQAVIQETGTGITITAYDQKLSGTVRIGGKRWDSTLGDAENIHVIAQKDTMLHILDMISSGNSVAGVYPRKASQGFLSSTDVISAEQLYTGFHDALSSGTIQIGGKQCEASIGSIQNGAVEIGISGDITLADLIQAGQDMSGTYPSAVMQGVSVMEQTVKNTEKVVVAESDLPAAGLLTSGGGALADYLYTGITSGAYTELSLAVAVPEPKAASADISCGSGGKTVENTETVETETSILAVAVTIRRCGSSNARCGKN